MIVSMNRARTGKTKPGVVLDPTRKTTPGFVFPWSPIAATQLGSGVSAPQPDTLSLVRLSVPVAVLAMGFFCASPARAQSPTPPAPRPVTLTVAWDSAPHTLSTARDFETLYALYGRGADALFGRASLDCGTRGVLARFAKAPLDVYVAWLATLGGHEFGHCQQAWLAGSHDCRWISAPGPYALGRIISVGDGFRLSSAERMAVTTGGSEASVAGADALKREIFTAARTDWTTSPLLVLRQLDLTLYGLTAPSPDEAGALDYANDMTNYALRYGARSLQDGAAIHTAIVRGALWNGADPMSWYAAYTYIGRYLIRGERTARAPGVAIGGRTWMVTTNAWLSEVGVRYALGVLSRGKADDVLEVTPSWGEGQPAVGARWSRDIRPGLRAGVSAGLWRQRASAAPGPLKTGGSIGAGMSRPFGRLVVSGDLGYKTAGVELTRPHAAGWFFSVGGSVRIRQ